MQYFFSLPASVIEKHWNEWASMLELLASSWHALLPHSSVPMEAYDSVATLFLKGSVTT